jgi:hypothetical protein
MLTSTTSCTPMLDPHFFDGAPTATEPLATDAICPSGYSLIDPYLNANDLPGAAASPQRLTTEAELLQAFCKVSTASDGGTSDGGVDSGSTSSIDFATTDVVVATTYSFGATVPLVRVGTDLWLQLTGASGCGGARPAPRLSLYAVPKATQVKSQTCTTTCSCTGGPCALPP